MAEPANEPPLPIPPRGTLTYRSPGREPKSQWLTDDQAYGGCHVYALLAVSVFAAFAAGIVAIAGMMLGW